jgi:type IV secretion system protein VirB10
MSEENGKEGLPPGEASDADATGNVQTFESSKPAVASAPGKTIFILLGVAIIVFIIVRSLFFSGSDKPAAPPPKIKETVTRPEPVVNITPPVQTVNVPNLPPPPPVQTPPVLQPPTFQPPVAKGPNDEVLRQRIRSPMVITGGGLAAALAPKKMAKTGIPGEDPNIAWERSIEPSQADQVSATRINNLNTTIAQGKVIQGILETAINSDLPGQLRAIVSHDIYAEAGKDILVPKGSRIIGSYNSSVKRGQARVFIIWTRVIRPDGVDIEIDSPGTDALGRAGLGGYVDNKYFEMFSTALLTSSLDIGVAAAGQGLFGNQQQTTTQGGGGVTTTSSPTSSAMQEAVANVGTVGNSIVNSTINLGPTITVDQGTPINIFVNKDLIFPPAIAGQYRFVE